MRYQSRSSAMRVIAKPEHSSLEWLQLRHRDEKQRVVFGASEAASLMNASLYETRATLIARKMADVEVSEPSPAMMSGNLIEPVLIAEAARRLDRAIVTPSLMIGRGRLVATPDGIDQISVMRLAHGERIVPDLWIEAKCTSRFRVKTLEDVPQAWLWQMTAQSFVCSEKDDAPTMMLVVLDADLHVNLIEIPRNVEAETLLAQTADRIGEMIDHGEIADEEIAAMTADEIARIFKARDESVELPNDVVDWLFALEDAKQMRKQAEEQESRARDWIAQHLRDATSGTLDGEIVVTWKEQQGRVSIDAKRLEQDHPDLVAQYKKQSDAYRVMRVSRKKGTK